MAQSNSSREPDEAATIPPVRIPRSPEARLAWLDRQLGPDGVPRSWPVESWGAVLRSCLEANPTPDASSLDRLIRLAVAVVRTLQPNGATVFGTSSEDRPERAIREVLQSLPDPSLAALSRRWFPRRGEAPPRRQPPPPTPGLITDRLPIAVLRSDWEPRASLLAMDQRNRTEAARISLIASGAPILGPDWGRPCGPARLVRAQSNVQGDFVEWTCRCGTDRLVRTLVFMPDRKLALIAEQVEGPGSLATLDLGLAPGVRAEPHPETPAWRLTSGKVRAEVLPLAITPHGPHSSRGRLMLENGRLSLQQPRPERRLWLPILVSWDANRLRRQLHWRVLTVSERGRICPTSVAFAARLGWGRGESLVFYRSLAEPANRAFLGCPTTSSFLIGRFTTEGTLETLFESD